MHADSRVAVDGRMTLVSDSGWTADRSSGRRNARVS